MPEISVSTPAEGITTITLNRPDQLNALNERLVTTLTATLDEIAEDSDCRIVLITGAGRGFCAGLDLKAYYEAPDPDAESNPIDLLRRQRDIAGLAQKLRALPQPVIAAVNGPAAGAGLALVCASDIRIATETALFAVSFIRAGYSGCDIGVSWLLPRIVGAGHAHELMLTGRRVDADEALRMGLVTHVVPAQDLQETTLAKAHEIMLNPPFSVELTKQGMWSALETPGFSASVEFENRQQVLTAMTSDQTEAAEAYLGKRRPSYQRR